MEISYPTRCQIVDVTGDTVRRSPEESMPHIGKKGLAEAVVEDGYDRIRITLDDGTVLNGSECWWIPLDPKDSVFVPIEISEN